MDTIDDLALTTATARLLARIGGFGLDTRLAGGAEPDGRRLAARAAWLTSRHHRTDLADAWTRLLDHAREAPTVLDGRVPVARAAVLAAGPRIVELADAVRGPAPIDVATVAGARVLLTDGTGPVYTGRDLALRVDALVTQIEGPPELSVSGEVLGR